MAPGTRKPSAPDGARSAAPGKQPATQSSATRAPTPRHSGGGSAKTPEPKPNSANADTGAGPVVPRLTYRTPKELSARRNLPGVANYTNKLPKAHENWLRGSDGNAGKIPQEIADKLAGRQFRDFNHFRKEFWKEVSKNPKLMQGFGAREKEFMRNGLAPTVSREQALGNRIKYELDHVHELQHGGEVFGMNNIIVRTPLNHLKGK